MKRTQLPTITILDAMSDPKLFGPYFPESSWRSWHVFLAALFGLPISEADLPLFQQCTGRTKPPAAPSLEAYMPVGRRGGKSRIAALIALFLACFKDHREFLAPGEVGTLPVIASDRKQARTIMRYLTGMINAVPMLKAMLASEPTKETIEFTNRSVIEIMTASVAAVRNYTLIGAVCDELAFWCTDEDGANPDTEILNALEPGMGTIPDAMLICLSSPYARRGALWEAYHEHFGHDDDEVLVWQADTATMHPHTPESRLGRLIAKAYEKDDVAASAEYGAQFRRDLETFMSPDIIKAVVMTDRRELPPMEHARYYAFTDPAGGSGTDSMTLAIAHRNTENGRVVLDAVREKRPPFNPKEAVAEFAALLHAYRVSAVTGDRYAGEWPRQEFRDRQITYKLAEKPKSDLYRDCLPIMTSGAVELLDLPRLAGQLKGLERRTARSGKDSIDHAPRGHDDVANAAAGVLLMVGNRKREGGTMKIGGW